MSTKEQVYITGLGAIAGALPGLFIIISALIYNSCTSPSSKEIRNLIISYPKNCTNEQKLDAQIQLFIMEHSCCGKMEGRILEKQINRKYWTLEELDEEWKYADIKNDFSKWFHNFKYRIDRCKPLLEEEYLDKYTIKSKNTQTIKLEKETKNKRSYFK